MIYNVLSPAHALFSGKFLALDEPKKLEHVLLAETLLKLPETPWTGRAAEQAELAIVLQCNYQVEYGTDPFVYNREYARVQGESRAYKDLIPLIDPRAQEIVDEAAEIAGFGRFSRTLRSLRGPNR